MKLNADIIFEQLSRHYPIKMFGKASTALLLSQPELYLDHVNKFYENHVYLATVEHLPHRPTIEKNVVLIVIGDGNVLAYYKEHAVVLQIQKKIDFYEVYQQVNHVYEIYSDWESRSLEMFLKSPSVEDILASAKNVLDCPAFVLNSSFQFLAFSDNAAPSARIPLKTESFLEFLREKDLSMDVHGAFVLKMSQGSFLCVNLFNSFGEYIGCMYLDQTQKEFLPGQKTIAEYLAHMIEKVYDLSPSLINHEKSSLKEILKHMMHEDPLEHNQKLLLKAVNNRLSYRCVSAHYLGDSPVFPVQYICSVFEGLITDSIFFEYHNTLLGLIPAEQAFQHDSDRKTYYQHLNALVTGTNLCIGLSNSFSDLYMLRTYYYQAEAAIENGQIYGSDSSIYRFSDYVLTELIGNALGGLPVDVYYPKGFQALMDHDQNAGISYLETLRVFFEENMSYARASRRLFVHRSTLIERIERIEKELEADFSDPAQRLYLEILLKALELEEKARAN